MCPRFWGLETGPSPVNRRKSGSKHQLITDAGGIPLAFLLTAANRNDCSELVALVEAIPPIRGKRGRPKRRPACVVGDRGSRCECRGQYRDELPRLASP